MKGVQSCINATFELSSAIDELNRNPDFSIVRDKLEKFRESCEILPEQTTMLESMLKQGISLNKSGSSQGSLMAEILFLMIENSVKTNALASIRSMLKR